MKQVVLSYPNNCVILYQISLRDFLGFEIDGEKYFLTAIPGLFIFKTLNQVLRGARSGDVGYPHLSTTDDLRIFLESIIKETTVLKFDTSQELLEWLSSK